MNVLPLRFLIDQDKLEFPDHFIALGKLSRIFEELIPEGVVITPPLEELNQILAKKEINSTYYPETKQKLIKKDLEKLDLPLSLKKQLKEGNGYVFNGQVYKTTSLLWQEIKNSWLEEITPSETVSLKPKMVFSLSNSICKNLIKKPILASFDPILKEVVIKSEIKLLPSVLKQINDCVIKLNRKLFLPYKYTFFFGKKLYLVGIEAFTHPEIPVHPSITDEVGHHSSSIPWVPNKKHSSAVKIFTSSVCDDYDVDGYFIDTSRTIGNDELIQFIDRIFERDSSHPLIVKLPDLSDHDVSGALRLIFDSTLFENITQALLFLRNKRGYHSLEIAIPFVRSPQELSQIKQQLASKGLSRKGSLKYWLEMKIPENFINIKQYLEVGVDGIIIDLDQLHINLLGLNSSEKHLFSKHISPLVDFLKPFIKITKEMSIPLLFKGSLTQTHEMLDFIVLQGGWGIVAESSVQAQILPSELSWFEKMLLIKKHS